MRPGGGGGRTRADEVKNETFFYIHTTIFLISFLSFISLGLVDGRVRDDQSFWVLKVKTISKCVVASLSGSILCVHEARSHSGTLTFHKEVDPKGEIDPRGELGRYLVRWRGRVDDGRRGPENKKKLWVQGLCLGDLRE